MNIGFIGCGNLAQLIISGLVSKKVLPASKIIASNRSQKKLQEFSKKTKIKKAKNNLEVVRYSDIIVFGTKPQDLKVMIEEISPFVKKNQIIISLAAGVQTGFISKFFPGCAIVRVMANLPAKIQMGVFGIYFFKTTPAMKSKIVKMFSAIGCAVTVRSEKQIDHILAGSASGVGFIFEFMRIFEAWYHKKGFDSSMSRCLSIETFLGAAQMARFSQLSPEQLRNAVTSKKGTTLAGLKSLKKSQIVSHFEKALAAAERRSRQLSQNILK